MIDLLLGLLLLAIATMFATALGWQIGRRISGAWCDCFAVVVVVTAGIYGNFVWQRVSLAEAIPFSNLIVVANWFPIFAAFLVALAWQRIPGGSFRRGLSGVSLNLAAWFAVVYPLLGESPSCGDIWMGGEYCVQTTDYTCTAASAASLLRVCDIAATEQEMADLCLTRQGTTWQGLYRGLKLKTQGTEWDVRVVRGDAERLIASASSPLILSVGLAAGAEVDGAYEREFGWTPGLRHTVLLLGPRVAGRVEIVDPNPAIGRESWTVEELTLLYRGSAMQIVPRKKNPSS
ncbi:MAG: hypothetical protein H6823_11820 [Planctomycetaceae bacterium]|nr:hypothetical protein [Planctomycetales bacterium]MCB9938924.1 hypothetical protein [Planctomycetaceae bacterium]